jgi:hypothetical protein
MYRQNKKLLLNAQCKELWKTQIKKLFHIYEQLTKWNCQETQKYQITEDKNCNILTTSLFLCIKE